MNWIAPARAARVLPAGSPLTDPRGSRAERLRRWLTRVRVRLKYGKRR